MTDVLFNLITQIFRLMIYRLLLFQIPLPKRCLDLDLKL